MNISEYPSLTNEEFYEKCMKNLPFKKGNLITLTNFGRNNIRNLEELSWNVSNKIAGYPTLYLNASICYYPVSSSLNEDTEYLIKPVISLLVDEKVIDIVFRDTPFELSQEPYLYITFYKKWMKQ